MIKNNLMAEYAKYKETNGDPYGKAVVVCGESFMNAVDEGKSFDEAEQIMLDTEDGKELTGYMMGALISASAHFHERGDEIKAWWNQKSDGTPDETGVKNPAIITVN